MEFTTALELGTDFGPHVWGGKLVVNPSPHDLKNDSGDKYLFCDVEDDENDGFVGVGLSWDGKHVYYFTSISDWLKRTLERSYFIGHNFKSDMHKLVKWGINIRSEQLVDDTMIMSYVQNSTKESHGLKELAKEFLGLEWPSYDDIVGKGRKRLTLDKQDVAIVSRYNGCDVLATARLHHYFKKVLTQEQRYYYKDLELPVTRILFDMEERGVMVDAQYLRELDISFGLEISRVNSRLQMASGSKEPINFNSPKQVQQLLSKTLGVSLASTAKEALKPYSNIPFIQLFRRYRELTKLRSTYTSAFLSLDTLPRIHASFNQCSYSEQRDTWGGIRTGRLSSSSPNLQNIPTRTALGDSLRRAFVAREGCQLADFDYDQIEWKIAAHFSQDAHMIQVLKEGKDPYQLVADKAKRGRDETKTAMLAMNFNATGYKVADILNLPEKEGFIFVDAYKATFPQYFKWKDQLVQDCNRLGYIETLFGRIIRPEKPFLAAPYKIQGSAAEIIKKAMVECVAEGFTPILTVHDELMFEFRDTELKSDMEKEMEHIADIMRSVVQLTVPLSVTYGLGRTWADAKA